MHWLTGAALLVSSAFIASPPSSGTGSSGSLVATWDPSHVAATAQQPPSIAPTRRVARARELARRARSPTCQFGPPQLPGLGRPAGTSTTTTTKDGIVVDILTTGINSRCISASIVVNAAPSKVWAILTDYDNLATHVPNLVESSLRPHPSGGIRLFQEGAQKIIGFDFRASLTMDMTEVTEDGASRPSLINFQLVDSAMFASFDGEWRVKPYSRSRSRADPSRYEYKSKLSYRVNITPKGLVPVPALEWRIREDVPVNLLAVRAASEKLSAARS